MEVRFEQGIPGFEELKKFVLIQDENDGFFANLQSIEQEQVVFLMVDPFAFYPSYEFQLPAHIKDEMKLQDEKDVQVWSIVTVGEKLEDSTLNLLAPVILNKRLGLGRQVILQDTPHQTKQRLIQTIADPIRSKE